ncbi:CDP-diacylglycerol--glycerol-3-phosphate 3-phosphatidyltransferase [Candidatus Entotheonellaceae bacterium PAL068K]
MTSFIPDRHLFSIPNLVTLVRPVCTLPFILLCDQAQLATGSWSKLGVLCLYVLIVSSDSLDGYLARRLKQASPLGRSLDHVCDVVFILSTLGYFVTQDLVPWWLPAAIGWAFVLYVADSWRRTARHPQRVLLASRLGHLGGILFYVTVGVITGNLCTANRLFPPTLLTGWYLILTVLASLSGTERLILLLSACRDRSRARHSVKSPPQSAHSEP